MVCNSVKDIPGGVVKDLHLPGVSGISGPLLPEHLDHHIVCRLIDERDHDLLVVKFIGAVWIFFCGSLGNLPDKIPGKGFGKGIAQSLYIGLVYIAGFCRTHERQGVVMAADLTFLQKLRHDLGFFRRVESHLASSQAVVFISEKIIQRHYHVVSGHVSGNVIRVSNTYVRGCIRRNIGDHIIVNISIICVKPQVYRNIRI